MKTVLPSESGRLEQVILVAANEDLDDRGHWRPSESQQPSNGWDPYVIWLTRVKGLVVRRIDVG